MILSLNMVNWLKTHRISLLLLPLLVFAHLPRTMSICLGADGALRTGLSCQCPACDDSISQQETAGSCGCGAAACASDPNEFDTTASIKGQECCAGFQLAHQLDSIMRQTPQAERLFEQLIYVVAAPVRRANDLPARLLLLCGQPPGCARPNPLLCINLRI